MISRYQIGLWTSNVKETRVKPIFQNGFMCLQRVSHGTKLGPWLFVFMIYYLSVSVGVLQR